MIKIKNIIKNYGKTRVLDGFSMECPEHGVIALMGASGIGKTTLLNIIAGIEKADSGAIESTFEKISYKFQEPRLLNWLTALENVESVLPDRSKDDAQRWLELVEVSDSCNKYPHELSGGMQQRVALTRALAYGGDLLLLDEPFSAVDSDTKRVLIKATKNYAQSRAVILVTHDISEAKELDATIITMK